jgi:hypothetical protein
VTVPVRPSGPEANQHGYVSTWVSPYGHLAGLRERLARWIDRAGRDHTLPWVGLGLVRDLEVAVQLLDLREFGEWLRREGGEHARFGDDLARLDDAVVATGLKGVDPAEALEAIDAMALAHEAQALQFEAMRKVLVEAGALDAKDRDTDPAALLRALLS